MIMLQSIPDIPCTSVARRTIAKLFRPAYLAYQHAQLHDLGFMRHPFPDRRRSIYRQQWHVRTT